MKCDFDDCLDEALEEVVFLNPNIAPPPEVREFYMACRRHALELCS